MDVLKTAEKTLSAITPPKVTVKTVKKFGKAGAVKVTGLFEEFKTFIARGNVIDLAIGYIIADVFSAIVKSLVNDLFSPFIALMLPGGTLEELFVILR